MFNSAQYNQVVYNGQATVAYEEATESGVELSVSIVRNGDESRRWNVLAYTQTI